MKKIFRLLAAVSIMAAVFSCDIIDPDSEEADNSVQDGGTQNGGENNGGTGDENQGDGENQGNGSLVSQDKKIKLITRSWVSEHRKLLAEVEGNEYDAEGDSGVEYLRMNYDDAGRVTAIRYEGGEWESGPYVLDYTLDHGTKGEIRVTRRRTGGPDWVDPLLYVRLVLDDKGYTTSYWQSTTSAFLNMEKMCELSYSEDGVLMSLNIGAQAADFIYTDGLLTSLAAGEDVSICYIHDNAG